MRNILGTKVEIHQKNKDKGKIEIEYYSSEELNRLLELIQTIQKN
jgi:ParB family chromosome partitioning protein